MSDYPTYNEIMEPAEFLRRVGQGHEKIRHAKTIPAQLGEDHFGMIEVTYETTVYQSPFEKWAKS